jgi:hypothetical protein
MKNYILFLGTMVFISFARLHACENCDGYVGHDWCNITIQEEDPHQLILILAVSFGWSCEDGWDRGVRDIPPIFYIELIDRCTGQYQLAWSQSHGDWRHKAGGCAVICGKRDDCACSCPPCCGVHNQLISYYSVDLSYIPGKFRIYASFKGQIIFNHTFIFDDLNEPAAFEGFTWIELQDLFGNVLSEQAILDIDEPFQISTTCDWSSPNFTHYVWAVVKSSGTPDSLLFRLDYVNGGPEDALYSSTISSIRQLYVNPESHFGYYTRDLLTIYPQAGSCPPVAGVVHANVNVGIYQFNLYSIKFDNDIQICRHQPGEPDNVEIIPEPQWLYNVRNEPACYIRNQPIEMTVVLGANFEPHHTFPVILQGITDYNPRQYNTFP